MFTTSRIAALLVAGAATFAPALGTAGIVAAEPLADESFLSQLGDSGIVAPAGAEAIALAQDVCATISDGVAPPDGVMAAVSDSTGLNTSDAAQFVYVSVLSYCSENLYLIAG